MNPPRPVRRVGVLGTLIWDRIWSLDTIRDGGEPFEDWGGITYSLAAMAAALPEGWEIVPIVKLGEDVADDARALLRTIPRVRVDDGVAVVPESNNRVDLRYWEVDRRCETLSGGVPPWRWEELAPRIGGLDALYLNFISGFEMDLADAERVRGGFAGPVYGDVHSLMLGRGPDGRRMLRPLPEWSRWLRCFDAIQVNEDELATLADGDDPRRFAADLVADGPGLAFVTRAGSGASVVARPGFPADPAKWPAYRAGAGEPAGRAETRDVPLPGGPVEGDPTGCGDVWGGTLFGTLLGGSEVDRAVLDAHRAAARNVLRSGASGLFAHLAGAARAG